MSPGSYLVVDVVSVGVVLPKLDLEVTRLTAWYTDRLQLSAFEACAVVVGERDVAHVVPFDASHVFDSVGVLVAGQQL